MTLTDQTLSRSTLRLADGVAQLDVRLPWYRSMPVGCMGIVALRIGDHEVAPADISWWLRGELRSASEAADDSTLWFLQDPVGIQFPLDDSSLGDRTSIEVGIDFLVTVSYLAPGVPPQLRVAVTETVPIHLAAR